MSVGAEVYASFFTIRVDGSSAPGALIDALSQWRVTQRLSQPASCALTFCDTALPSVGLRLGCRLDLDGPDDCSIFSGTVTSVHREKRSDGLHILDIRAHDGLDRLRRRQSMALRHAHSLAGIVGAAVAEAGFNVEADEDGPELPLILQWGRSDLDWISTLCATYGWYFVLDGDTLRMLTLDGGSDPIIEIDTEESLFEVSLTSDAVMLRTEANACAWNPLTVEAHSVSAMDFTLDGVGDWAEAPAELSEVVRDIVGGAGPLNAGATSRVAQADLERAVKRAHVFSGLAEGDARLRPGSRVRIQSGSEGLDGEFALTQVAHSYVAESGYTTWISSEPPADPVRLSGSAVSLGLVSDTDDPEAAGRVRVLLKAFNDAESDWLIVCSLGAGADKGLVLQPEAGDSVLVAFVNDNPAQGVVLGGVFGAHGLHDTDVATSRPRPCTLRTRDGQLIRLDDQQGAVHLESRGGVLDLNPDGVALHAEADLQITAPGRTITIVADRVDFRRG